DYADPSRLYNAQPATIPVRLSVTLNQLTIAPNAGYVGTFVVIATVSDGLATAQQTFRVTVGSSNSPPTLAAIPDQTTAPGSAFTVTLSASDPDGDTLTFTPRADTLAYGLEQQYGFHLNGSYYTNWGGRGEKWFVDSAGLSYFILPNGGLYLWDG